MGFAPADAGRARIGGLWYCKYQPMPQSCKASDRILFPWSAGTVYCAENRNANGRSFAERFFPSLRLKISGELNRSRFLDQVKFAFSESPCENRWVTVVWSESYQVLPSGATDGLILPVYCG